MASTLDFMSDHLFIAEKEDLVVVADIVTGLEVETVISLAVTDPDQEVEVAGQEAEIGGQGVEAAGHVAGIAGHVAEERVDVHEVEINVLAVGTRARGNAQEAETKTVRAEKKVGILPAVFSILRVCSELQ